MGEHIIFNETLENNLKTTLNIIKVAGAKYNDKELLQLYNDLDLLVQDNKEFLAGRDGDSFESLAYEHYQAGYSDGYSDGHRDGFEEGYESVEGGF